MPSSSPLTEQLAALGVHLPAWPEEPDRDATDDWIERGQAYAEWIRLLRVQLRTAAEMEGSEDRLVVVNAQNISELPAKYQVIVRYLLSDPKGIGVYECVSAANQLLSRDDFTDSQRLGLVLELARSGFLRLSVHSFMQIIEIRQPSENQCLKLCALLVSSLSFSADSQILYCRENLESWRQSVALFHEATNVMVSAISRVSGVCDQAELLHRIDVLIEASFNNVTSTLNRWEYVHFRVSEALANGEAQNALNVVRCEWVTTPFGGAPEGVKEKIYADLLLNACSVGRRQQPRRWLIESRSLPRSGHHFLKNLLKHVWGENFSYCEGYQEPGCCKASPCSVDAYWHFARERKRPHLRLLKSHDFALNDSTFDPLPGMARLIQIRRPFDLLVSWLELEQLNQNRALLEGSAIVLERIYLYHEPELLEAAWKLIDKTGTTMSADQVQQWLEEKVYYVVGFLRKWLPLAKPLTARSGFLGGNVLLCYEDLGECQILLQALGRGDFNAEQLPAFAPRHQLVMMRPAAKVTELIQASRALLLQANADVMGAVPEMQILYPEPIQG